MFFFYLLIFIFMMINYFLSGHMVPLDWLPSLFSRWPAAQEFVRQGMMYLPFPYLATPLDGFDHPSK